MKQAGPEISPMSMLRLIVYSFSAHFAGDRTAGNKEMKLVTAFSPQATGATGL